MVTPRPTLSRRRATGLSLSWRWTRTQHYRQRPIRLHKTRIGRMGPNLLKCPMWTMHCTAMSTQKPWHRAALHQWSSFLRAKAHSSMYRKSSWNMKRRSSSTMRGFESADVPTGSPNRMIKTHVKTISRSAGKHKQLWNGLRTTSPMSR